MKVLGILFLAATGTALAVRGVLPDLPAPLPAEAAVSPLPAAPEPQAAGDFATLKGSVKIKGEIPKRKRLPTQADPKCAAMHGKDGLYSEDVVADAAGNVQWALVYVKDGLGERKYTPPKEPAIVEQKGCRFEPHVFGVQAGQDVKFRNGDNLMHIVHVTPKNNREFGFSQEKPGEERVKVFANKETIRVFCDVHQWMVAWAVVLDHPLFAVTGPDGKYTLKNLPPGKYTIEVWHEKYKPVTQEIEVKAKETKTAALLELTDLQ
jgi:plastocyanin